MSRLLVVRVIFGSSVLFSLVKSRQSLSILIMASNLFSKCSAYFLACLAWRFWLGALSNKVGRGQRNREEIGAEATYFSRGCAARSSALRARISRLRRYAARLNKTAMLRRLLIFTAPCSGYDGVDKQKF